MWESIDDRRNKWKDWNTCIKWLFSEYYLYVQFWCWHDNNFIRNQLQYRKVCVRWIPQNRASCGCSSEFYPPKNSPTLFSKFEPCTRIMKAFSGAEKCRCTENINGAVGERIFLQLDFWSNNILGGSTHMFSGSEWNWTVTHRSVTVNRVKSAPVEFSQGRGFSNGPK